MKTCCVQGMIPFRYKSEPTPPAGICCCSFYGMYFLLQPKRSEVRTEEHTTDFTSDRRSIPKTEVDASHPHSQQQQTSVNGSQRKHTGAVKASNEPEEDVGLERQLLVSVTSDPSPSYDHSGVEGRKDVDSITSGGCRGGDVPVSACVRETSKQCVTFLRQHPLLTPAHRG